jgi:hypothetical protein
MPTGRHTVSLIGQKGCWLWAGDLDGSQSYSITVQVDDRDTLGEIALYDAFVLNKKAHMFFPNGSETIGPVK